MEGKSEIAVKSHEAPLKLCFRVLYYRELWSDGLALRDSNSAICHICVVPISFETNRTTTRPSKAAEGSSVHANLGALSWPNRAQAFAGVLHLVRATQICYVGVDQYSFPPNGKLFPCEQHRGTFPHGPPRTCRSTPASKTPFYLSMGSTAQICQVCKRLSFKIKRHGIHKMTPPPPGNKRSYPACGRSPARSPSTCTPMSST